LRGCCRSPMYVVQPKSARQVSTARVISEGDVLVSARGEIR
jgi:hypothetical protein